MADLVATSSNIQNTLAEDFNIYPNPSNGKFMIESKLKTSNYAINNMLGQQVLSSQITDKVSVDITSMPKGLYLDFSNNYR